MKCAILCYNCTGGFLQKACPRYVVASSYVLHSGLNFTESYWFLLQEVSGLPNIYTQSLRATGTKTEGVHIMNVLIVTSTFGKHVVWD